MGISAAVVHFSKYFLDSDGRNHQLHGGMFPKLA